VRASFTGETDPAEEVYYSPVETQATFQPEAFNIYQMLMNFTGAFVSIIAFVILYIPFAYMREVQTNDRSNQHSVGAHPPTASALTAPTETLPNQ